MSNLKFSTYKTLEPEHTKTCQTKLDRQWTIFNSDVCFFKLVIILLIVEMCKKKKTLKKKDIPTICHDILRIILVTPHDHIGSEETKIKLIQNNFTKAQVQDVLKSKTVIVIRPIPNYKDYEVFLKYVINSILLNRPLPLF